MLAGTFNRDAQTLTAGDLNGDGLADLVLTSYSVYQYTGVLIVHALPDRTWGPSYGYFSARNYAIAHYAHSNIHSAGYVLTM